MRQVKKILSNIWDAIWELVAMIFLGAVGIIAIPLMIVFIVISSFYYRETPGEAMVDICDGITEAIEEIKNKD